MTIFPMQPVATDERGVLRFVPNRIVEYLHEEGPTDMNDIAIMSARGDFTAAERAQFAQLIGYSVSGFCDLTYASPEDIARLDAPLAAINVNDVVQLRVRIHRMDDEQALVEIASMEGPYSLRVPISELSALKDEAIVGPA